MTLILTQLPKQMTDWEINATLLVHTYKYPSHAVDITAAPDAGICTIQYVLSGCACSFFEMWILSKKPRLGLT